VRDRERLEKKSGKGGRKRKAMMGEREREG
jgi:hypothetical protein